MKLTITINLDNEAFTRDHASAELTRILNDVAAEAERGLINPGNSRPLQDSNGNTVGTATVTEGPGAQAEALSLARASIQRLITSDAQRRSVQGTLDVICKALEE